MTAHRAGVEAAHNGPVGSDPSTVLVFTDTRIENDVRAALQGDPCIKHPELIAVSVDEIGTVVLCGAVESLPQRLAARHDARQIDGVFEVIVDDLNVHIPFGRRHGDDQIRTAAVQRLTWDSRIRSTHIHATVSHGRVTLTGHVSHASERDAAEEDVTTLDGVVGVTNKIEIR
jgi:osmotically-inducible protein OsmY